MQCTKKPEFDAFQYLLEFPTGRSAKRVVLPVELQLSFHEQWSLTLKIQALGGEVVSEEYMCSATHVVGSGLCSYSPTLLEALARGLWVVDISYIVDSYEQLQWLDELEYEVKLETDDKDCAVRRNRELALVRRSPNLSAWKIGLLTDDDPSSKSVFMRLLEAGGATYFHISKRTEIFTFIYEIDWVLVCGRSVNCKEIVKRLLEHGILCIRLGFLIGTLLMCCPEPMTKYIFHTNDISCDEQDTEFNLVMYGYSKKRKMTFMDQDNSNRKREKLTYQQRCTMYNAAPCETKDYIGELDIQAVHSNIYESNCNLEYNSSHCFLNNERAVLQSVTEYPECGCMEDYYSQSRVESHENLTTYFLNDCCEVENRKCFDSLSQELEETSQPEESDDVDFSPEEDSPDEIEILENYVYDESSVSELQYKSLDVITLEDHKEVTDCVDLCTTEESKDNSVSKQNRNTKLYSKDKAEGIRFSNESYGIDFRPDSIKRHNPSTDEESGFHSLTEEEKVDDVVAKEYSANLRDVDVKHEEVQKEICCEVSNQVGDVSQLLLGGSDCVSMYSGKFCSGDHPSKKCQYTEVNSSQANDINDQCCIYDSNKSGIGVMDRKSRKKSAHHCAWPKKLCNMTAQEIRKLVKAHIEAELDNPWLSLGVNGPPICCEGTPAHVKMFSVPASNILKSMLHNGLWYEALHFFDMAVDIGIIPDAHAIQMMFDLILDTHDEYVLASTRCSIDRLFRKYPPCSLHLNVFYKKVLASKPEDDLLHHGGMVATLLDLLEDEMSDTSETEKMFASGSKSEKNKYMDLPKSTRYQRIFMLLNCITDALASDLGRWIKRHYLSVDRALWPERPLAESALRQWGIGIPTKSDIRLLFRVCLQLGAPGKLSHCQSDSLLRLMHIAAEVFRINEDNQKVEYPLFGTECEFFANQLFLQIEEYGLDSETISQFLDSVTPAWVTMLVGKRLVEKQLGESLRHPLISVAAVLKERLKNTRETSDDENQPTIKEKLLRKEDITKDISAGKNLLHSACAQGNVHAVDHILSTSFIDVNECDCSGNTALYIAVQNGHKNCVSVLLKFKPANGSRRVNVSIGGECGGPPILAAAGNGRSDICHMLFKHSGPMLLDCVSHHQLKTVLKSVPEDLRSILQDPWKFYGHVVPPLCRPLSQDLWFAVSPLLPVITKSYLHAYNFIAVNCGYNVHRRIRRNRERPTSRTIGQNVAHCYRIMCYQFCSLLKVLRRIKKCKESSFNVDAYESISILDTKLQVCSGTT